MDEIVLKSLFGSWYKPLKLLFPTTYFNKLIAFLNNEYKKHNIIYPTSKKNIFDVFLHTNFDDVKVVMLGTEPGVKSGPLAYSATEDALIIEHESVRIRDNIEREYETLLIDFDFTFKNKSIRSEWQCS